ncbi:hypothetical protein K501DRAFT_284822, partial [Backusella circina FSU 941]
MTADAIIYYPGTASRHRESLTLGAYIPSFPRISAKKEMDLITAKNFAGGTSFKNF